VAVLLLSTFALSLYRVTTRETFNAPVGESKMSRVVAAIQDPLGLVTRYDVSSFDKLVLLEEDRPALRFGSTYASALLAPIPGADSATLQGGNRAFTERYIPERYARNVTFEGVSMLGEAHLNFGPLGVPLAGAAAGWAFGTFLRRAGDRRWMLVLAMAAGLFPSLIRADALNTAALGASLIIFTLFVSTLVTRRQHTRRPNSGARRRRPAPAPASP
jgi:hypothetical protein